MPEPHASPSIRSCRARAYERARDLPVLLSLWPSEITDMTYAGHLVLLEKLRRALREERKRGASGHWSYDLARHAALRNAYRAEVAASLTQPHSGIAHLSATSKL